MENPPAKKNWNRIVLVIFGPVLILTGVSSFFLPPGPMSAAAPYNVFHIVFGSIGTAFALSRKQRLIVAFNIGFGLIDLYQAAASFLHLFPERYFLWKTGDDVLHVLIGAGLVAIGLLDRSGKES